MFQLMFNRIVYTFTTYSIQMYVKVLKKYSKKKVNYLTDLHKMIIWSIEFLVQFYHQTLEEGGELPLHFVGVVQLSTGCLP